MPDNCKSDTLPTGEIVFVVEHPHGAWRIDRYEWQTEQGASAVMFAEALGWNRLEFCSAERAIAFADDEIARGSAPGSQSSAAFKVP